MIKRSKRCPDILYTSGAHIPPARSWKCYCNRDDRRTEPSMQQEVCILNEVSLRFGAAWPFSNSLNVRYFPLGVKRKDASAVFFPSMGALLNSKWEKGGRPLLLHFPYRMSGKTAIKSDPCLFLNLGERTHFFSPSTFTEIVLAMQMH